jgi:hypothetical protein
MGQTALPGGVMSDEGQKRVDWQRVLKALKPAFDVLTLLLKVLLTWRGGNS